jgi:transketolase N-terminal domain/subunit
MPTLDINYLTEKTAQMRKDVLKSIHNASNKYIGEAYSIIDILVSFFHTSMLRFYST